MIPSLLLLAQTGPVKPNLLQTPPERILTAYLRALNENDGKGMPEFVRENFELPRDRPELLKEIVRAQADLRKSSGGLDLGAIRSQAPARIVADVKSRRLGTWTRLSFYLAAEAPAYEKPTLPYRIVGLGIAAEVAPETLIPRVPLGNAEIARRLGSLMKTLVGDDAFAGVVFVARQGKPIFAHAYGLANRSYDVPNTLAMRFNLASITKMFTAVAVAQLVEQGKLSYGDTVGKILPDYPNLDVAKRVTIHHLLSHTSGMIGARALVEKNAPAPKGRTIEDQLPAFVNEPLSFTPGERFDYSNAGFILLGRIVEKVSGQDYYDYVREHVFLPAGMTQSAFLDLDVPTHNVASGYADGPKGVRLDNIFDLGYRGSPAGGAYATAADMDRFARALVAGRLVKASTLELMWTGVTSNVEQGTSYGYGATIERYAGQRIVSHGGGWKGITNHFEFFPELGVSVTVLGNTDSDPNSIAYKIREWIVQGARNAAISSGRRSVQ